MQFYVFDDRRAKVVLGPKAREFIQLQKNTGYDLQYRERIYACDQLTHFLSGMKVDADIKFYNQRGEEMLDHTRQVPPAEQKTEQKKTTESKVPVKKAVPPEHMRAPKRVVRVDIPEDLAGKQLAAPETIPAKHDLVFSLNALSKTVDVYVVTEICWRAAEPEIWCRDKNMHPYKLRLSDFLLGGHMRVARRQWEPCITEPVVGDSAAMPWHYKHNLVPDEITRIRQDTSKKFQLEGQMPRFRGYNVLSHEQFTRPDGDSMAARVLKRRVFEE